MSAQTLDQVFPAIPPPSRMPFHYSSLSSVWLFYRVNPKIADGFAADTGLAPIVFDGKAVAVLNFQRFTVHGPMFTGTNTLIECNVLAYPRSQEARLPKGISFREFLAGDEQTKLIGHFRLHVPSDNHYGVAGRQELWGVSTFYTTFEFVLPCLNYPENSAWSLTCKDPDGNGAILSIEAEFPATADPVPANISPIVQYSVLRKKLVCQYLNLAGPAQTYFPDREAQKKIEVTPGKSTHPMVKDVATLVAESPVVAIQRFESPPAAVEGRGVFVDRG